MSKRSSIYSCASLVLALLAAMPGDAQAATIHVPADGDLQAAINAAQPGDTITLAPGATYVGNFKLPVHGGTSYVTIRSAADDALLPRPGARMSPAYARYLPKIKSSNTMPAMRTLAAAGYWRLLFLEFQANVNGLGDIVALGSGSASQDSLAEVPYDIVVDRVYIHGDAVNGQKRGIGLNSGRTTIVNSYISEMKAIGQDSQAIAGWNGPGPYRIENNYLEAAAEVFLLGGDDPKIPNLVPSDVVVRGNTLSRPVRWRTPIVPAPADLRGSIGTGGSLPAGTYGYRVVARQPVSTTSARSAPSQELSVTVAAGSSIRLQWTPVRGATEYQVYRRTTGASEVSWKTDIAEFVDAGVMAGTVGSPSSKGTVWQVKNLFELKNAQRVQVDHNLMENNWAAAQNGFAILFTPRNQYGGCTWCVVRDVTFEHNVVRHIGGGINLLGEDYVNPSRQTTDIIVRHNEFSDLSKDWGGSGYFLMISDQPRRVTIDHNTVISPRGSGVITASGQPIYEFVFTNNVMRHNTYGIFGASVGSGNPALATYFPGAVVRRNVFAGGSASRYPAGNEFPSLAAFESRFVNYAAGLYSLVAGTSWIGSGTDGLDLGASRQELAAVESSGGGQPEVVTTVLPPTTEGETYAVWLEAAGGVAPYRWSITDGALPAGLTLDAATGWIEGVSTMAGDYAMVVRAEDSAGIAAVGPLTMHVERAIPPVSVTTDALPEAMVGVPYATALEAEGGTGSFTWAAASGTLPAGLSLAANGVIAGVPTAVTVGSFNVTVADANDEARLATRPFVLAVVRPPNRAPSVSASAPARVDVGAAVSLVAAALDADGWVSQVEFRVDGQVIGTSTATPFTMSWTPTSAGTFTVTAVAFDNEGASTPSGAVVLEAAYAADVILYGMDVRRMVGAFSLVDDATAAGGKRLWNPNRGLAKAGVSAAPASYAEFTFFAEAGRPYRLWLRASAEKNSYNNDSVWVQFSNVTGPRIGTTSAMPVILEDATHAGVSGWGWQDNGYGTGVVGVPVVFLESGLQTLRFLPREDGISIDQIVLSSDRYLTTAPGAVKQDTTILAR